MVYRKKKTGSDTWHFCTNCSLWPASDYVERTDKPSEGELCNQCKAKREAKTCQTKS